jgi:hypothetical protein
MLTIFNILSDLVRNKTPYLSLTVAFFFLLQVPCSHAQETGQIAGIVTDSTGAVVPGASVSARNSGTNAVRTTTTNGTGSYLFTGLPATVYEVSVTSAGGFGAFKAKAEVTVGGVLTLDIKLLPSASVETVTVEGEGGVAVNTQTQEVSQVVSSQQVSQLPSLSRNP